MNKQPSNPTPPELDVDLTDLSDALVSDMPIIPLPHKENDLPTPAPSPRPVEFQGILPTWSAINEKNEDSYLQQVLPGILQALSFHLRRLPLLRPRDTGRSRPRILSTRDCLCYNGPPCPPRDKPTPAARSPSALSPSSPAESPSYNQR
ncbi:hypothetical protein NEOLI_005460 [Neolecta irregularis DAH-3]|uniref:Uncharacterized protein n=1 Tax=Neolecta irregularis (strain DAH-3) TaxID=1198029 RepID=A0A1U7LKQ8_NEOID|nr:hypothetical protein NEOLI_005460 [Neolecta irregularis DAH-3]|eukprot:OLL23229.1 hypothetical protein NEOLI_005460 [Neolecta irregularis DAH-3]